jgi:hypothetical protein
MNYLERLVRRALASAGNATDPLHDPFEQTAPWELEPPQPVPSAKAGEAASLPATHETAELLLPEVAIEKITMTPAHDDPRPVEATPMQESQALAPAAVASVEAPLLAPVPAPAPGIPAIPTEEEALRTVDAFMRGLGVPLPPAAMRDAAARPDGGEAHEAMLMPSSRTAAAEAMPLAPAPTPLPPLPEMHEGEWREAGEAPDAGRASPASPARAPRPVVIERRQTIVVTRDGHAGDPGAATGAGAPRFGLGQL